MPPNRPAGGLKGRLRSPVAGIPQIQILAMLDSMAFFRGRILWITRLHVCQWVAYIRVRVAKVQVHQTHHQRAHQNTTHTLANFREVIVAVRRGDVRLHLYGGASLCQQNVTGRSTDIPPTIHRCSSSRPMSSQPARPPQLPPGWTLQWYVLLSQQDPNMIQGCRRRQKCVRGNSDRP